MMGALIGAGCALFLAAIAAALTAGKLIQEIKDLRKDVEEIPERMRSEIKLMIKEDLDRHCLEYIHDRTSSVAIQAVPRES